MPESWLKQQLSAEEDSPLRLVFKTKIGTTPQNLVFMVCMYLGILAKPCLRQKVRAD